MVKGSELCQTLGYHHTKSQTDGSSDELNHERYLFWCVYILDKGLSLRLGRASTISDWDITIPPPPLPSSQSLGQPGQFCLRLSVKSARCHGNIQELLHSPAALAQPDHIRQSNVETLRNQLNDLELELQTLKVSFPSVN